MSRSVSCLVSSVLLEAPVIEDYICRRAARMEMLDMETDIVAKDGTYFLHYGLVSKTPLVDYIADRLHCLPNAATVVQNLYNELRLSSGGGSRLTTLQKAKCILEHLQRPADVIDAVMAALEAAAAKRLANAKAAARPQRQEGDTEADAEEDNLIVRDTERDEWIGPPEDSDDDGDDAGAGSVNPAVSSAAVSVANDGSQRKAVEPRVDRVSSDGRPDGGSHTPGEAVAASVSAPSGAASGQREVLPMPRVLDIEGEPPEGCRVTLSPPTTTSSPCWIGRLPPRNAYMGQASICRSFKPDDFHDGVGGRRTTMSSAVARRTVLNWLWEWDALTDAEKQQERDTYFMLHPREALEDTGVSSRSAAIRSGDVEGPQPKRHKKS
jgi:hypothetical protein